MNALVSASERLPNWLRAVSILVLPVLGFFTNAALGTPAVRPLFTLFVLLTGFALFTHLPVLRFDGPLPFSERGVHHRDRLHPWEEVVAVEAAGEKDLQAVLRSGELVPLRVRGNRTREEHRAALARYKPEAARF